MATYLPEEVQDAGTVVRRGRRPRPVPRLLAWDAACAIVAATTIGAGLARETAPMLLLAGPPAWVVTMWLGRAYEPRILREGPEEFRAVLLGTARLLAALGTVTWIGRLDVDPGAVVVTVALACLLTVAHRYGHRAWRHRQRARGQWSQTLLVVGHRNGVAALHEQLRQQRRHGFRVIGCCLPSSGDRSFDGLGVLGSLAEVAEVADRHGVDAVAVLPSPELEGAALRRLGWQLQRSRVDLLLAPAVADAVGPLVRVRPSYGLPLLHVEGPELRGAVRLTKEVFDRGVALLGLVVMLPVLLAIAVALEAAGRGPVLVREERVGRGGQVFGMLRFRTTVGEGRMSDVGSFLRRHSLDELPQLLNVLRGEMSLVGPRPPLPAEVERRGSDLHQPLLKPGLTGLGVISGRRNLAWDDDVRMHLRYVENWSLLGDLTILAKVLLGSCARTAPGEPSGSPV